MTSRDFATSAQAHTSSTEDDTSVHPSHSHREVGLDIVRGLAVLGTFATNVWLFTHPGGLFGSLFDPLAGIDSSADLFVYGIAAGLPNGKFLALLMMVFGMGVTIQFAAWNRRNPPTSEPTTGDRARRRAWLRTYTPRALVLLIDGTVNFVLVAEFDILMGYAFTGVVVAALISGSPRTARVWAWCAGTLHVCGLLLLAGLLLAPAGPDPSSPRTNGRNQETPPAVDETASAATTAATAVHQDGSFVDLALFRLDNALLFRAEPVLTLALGVCLFLVGARLYDRGVFGAAGRPLRKRLMIVGASVLPVDLVLGFLGLPSAILLQRYLTAPFVALGLLGLLAHLARTRVVRTPLGRGTAAVGRMSLSVYVGQNLLAGALFYGWGLGLAGRFPDHRVVMSLAATAVVLAAMVAFATLWQKTAAHGAVRRGPLEAFTHSLIRRR